MTRTVAQNSERTETLNAIFEHLTGTPVDPNNPLQSMRALTEQYGRGEKGAGSQQVRIIEVDCGDLKADWHLPPNPHLGHRIVYLHGGGWAAGSRQSHRQLVAELAFRTGHPVLMPEYALAPEAPFPAGLNDVVKAVEFASRNDPITPKSDGKVSIAGDSAGGNLAAAYMIKALSERLVVPHKLALLSPFLSTIGLTTDAADEGVNDQVILPESIQIAKMLYAPKMQSDDSDLINPGDVDASKLESFPPVLIQISGSELLRNQSFRFSKKLWSQGIEARLSVWPDMPHVWQAFLESLPEADHAMSELSHFLNAARD